MTNSSEARGFVEPPDGAARPDAPTSPGSLHAAPEPALDSLARLAAQICVAPVGLVTVADGGRQVFAGKEFLEGKAGFHGPDTAPLDLGFCPLVAERRDALVIPDTLADPDHAGNAAAREGGVRFYAGVPILTEDGGALGTVCVLDTRPRPEGLTTGQFGALRDLAAQATSLFALRAALRRQGSLVAEQAAAIREREALAGVQAAISGANGDLDAILSCLVAGALEAAPAADGAVIELIDGAELEYRTAAGALSPHRGLRVPLAGSLAGWCATANAPVRIDDAREDPRVLRHLIEPLGLRAVVMAPIVRAGQVLGVLKLQSGRPAAFGPRELQIVRLFAGAASAGLTEVQASAAEHAGQASEARYRAIFESAIDYAIVATDLEGRVTNWNTGAAAILGWSADEMRGASADVFFTPEDRAAGVPAREMRAALTEGRGIDERWHLRRSGERFWANGEMTALRNAAGQPIGFVKILRDRTAEHLAGRRLAEAETRLRRAQEAGGIGLFTVTIADNLLEPTPEFCRLYGLPVRPAYPASAFENLLVPEDAHLASTDTSRKRGEPPRDAQYRIRRADTGELRWISRVGELEHDDSGQPIRFVGVARDVTERARAESALRESEEQFRVFAQAAPNHVWAGQPDGSLDWFNDQVYDYVGLAPGSLDGLGSWARAVHPEDLPDAAQAWARSLATGETYETEFRIRRADGVWRWFLVRAVPARAADGRILRWVGSNTDVEERKRSEARLQASEALVQAHAERVQLALAAGAIIGTWFWDLPSDRFTVDEGFARSFGLDPALGRDGLSLAQVIETVHPDDTDGLTRAIDAAIARGGAYAHPYRVRRADGRYYWIEANGRVDLSPDGTPVSFPGVLIDVEGRRAVEAERDGAIAMLRSLNETLEQRVADRTAELMEAEEQLRQSQKMEAVGQLTGGLAHDFNNLLAGISGALELMNTRLRQGRMEDVAKYMDAAQGAARRAASLTHRLLAFSRRQTLAPKPTDVNRLVAGLEELVRRTVGPGIAVEFVGAPDLWPALVDPSQLENALLNLCINARDAMPDGGRITVETANREVDGHDAVRHEVPEGQYLVLRIKDSGTGMTPDVLAKAFDPFFTTKPIGQGTGLGLSMIYGFAQQSGGHVLLRSEVGSGTAVSILLPRHLGDAPADDAQPDGAGGAATAGPATVLVVDDEPTVRMLVADVLGDLGYTAIEAGDGAAGLKILEAGGRIDLLVTDVGLPGGMNGRQMADAGRVTRPGLKVLFITGYAETAILDEGHLVAGMQVLTKPFAVDTLASRIRAMVAAP